MKISGQLRRVLKRMLFGPSSFPQQCTIGLRDPQSEVSVWLHGPDISRDVTHRHLMAGAAPFTICIGFDEEDFTNVTRVGA